MNYEQAYAERRGAFLAEHRRQPSQDEERELREAAREDARKAEAERHEADLRRRFMAQPGATDEAWRNERAGILRRDREQRVLSGQDAARAAQAELYRSF